MIERAAEGIPVVVYASSIGVSGRFEDLLFPVYRYYRNVFRPDGSGRTETIRARESAVAHSRYRLASS